MLLTMRNLALGLSAAIILPASTLWIYSLSVAPSHNQICKAAIATVNMQRQLSVVSSTDKPYHYQLRNSRSMENRDYLCHSDDAHIWLSSEQAKNELHYRFNNQTLILSYQRNGQDYERTFELKQLHAKRLVLSEHNLEAALNEMFGTAPSFDHSIQQAVALFKTNYLCENLSAQSLIDSDFPFAKHNRIIRPYLLNMVRRAPLSSENIHALTQQTNKLEAAYKENTPRVLQWLESQASEQSLEQRLLNFHLDEIQQQNTQILLPQTCAEAEKFAVELTQTL